MLQCQQVCKRRAKYSARNDEWPAKVSHWKLSRSSVLDKTSTVTKQLWLRKASHSTLLMGMHGRRMLNGSSVPRPTCETEEHRWRRCARGSMEADGEINQLSAVKAVKAHSRIWIHSGTYSQWISWTSTAEIMWSDFLTEKIILLLLYISWWLVAVVVFCLQRLAM